MILRPTGGWITLHRKLLKHPRFSDPDWLSVWTYLLLSATHAPLSAVFNGNPILLKPGQLVTGREAIARATGVDSSKVYRLLKTMASEQQIEQQPSGKHSLITVLNWHCYQKSEQR